MSQCERVVNLALVLEWLESAPLDDAQKDDLRSAALTACRWFKREPEDIPAHAPALRQLLRKVSPGTAGVSRKRLSSVKWGLRRLLDLMGLGSRGAHDCVLSDDWVRCLAGAREFDRVLLTRLGRFCSGQHIGPTGVSDTVSALFLSVLELDLRVSCPKTVHRQTVQVWNRNAAYSPDWPKQLLAVPNYGRKYVLDWQDFHPELVAEIEHYLGKQATDDPFDLSAPIEAHKSSTTDTYRDRLRRFASCLTLTGSDPQKLRLVHLVEQDAVIRGLRFLANERGASKLAAAVARLLAAIARDLSRPEQEVADIAEIATRLRKTRKGLSSAVRERLAPLKDEANLARLFLFPDAIMRRLLRKAHPEIKDAQLFQCALALALLTVCPLRIASLCSLRLDRHLRWSAGPMKGDLTIEFQEGELKGNEPASFPIPKEVADRMRIFFKRFCPLLNPANSPFLFNGRDPARPRCKNGFSTRLRQLIFDRLGLWVYPHLYRHIVHLVVLKRFPGAYALIARVLTHRSINTTIRNYSAYDGELAMREYQRLVAGVKGGDCRDADGHGIEYTLGGEARGHVSR